MLSKTVPFFCTTLYLLALLLLALSSTATSDGGCEIYRGRFRSNPQCFRARKCGHSLTHWRSPSRGCRSVVQSMMIDCTFSRSGWPNERAKSSSSKASVLMQRLSYPTETVISNKITRNRIVLSFKDSPRKPLRRRPLDLHIY